jgi:hypothetical protein
MRKGLIVAVCAILLGTCLIFTGCDGDDDALAGVWLWQSSSWTGPFMGMTLTFDHTYLAGFGATLSIEVDADSDGTFAAVVVADDVSGGDLTGTVTGTWEASDTEITITANGQTAVVPYTVSGDTLTVTLTTDQLVALSGEPLPAAYWWFSGGTAVVTLTR